MAYKITIDIGGTFSDVVISDFTRILHLEKAPTTTGRAFVGLRTAFERIAERLGLDLAGLLAETAIVIYGTTRATNSIVERKVARTAFVTTAGFGDTLIFREGGKFKPHEFSVDYPSPYIPRIDTFELAERIDSEGGVVRPLGADELDRLVAWLRERKVDAVGVSLLWSFENPAHELAVGARLAADMPGLAVTLSHRLLPTIREYRRASTVCIDASLKPMMQSYLLELQRDLLEAGFAGTLFISTSSGGCAYLEEAVERPVLLVKSGPAMAPLAATNYTEGHAHADNVIVCDTGGTTFDVGIVRDRLPTLTRETWLGERWTGDLVNVPSVDVRSIGAGGGSIAWIDEGGLLHVGPTSAGAMPGPACYGNGGTEATVTDAAVVLGYIDPDYFLGGRIRLDTEAAERVVQAIADRLGISRLRAADAILRIANETMIKAIQQITINEGINPRDAVLVGGGGAAGLDIAEIGRELGCREVIVPRLAGAFSATGMQVADIVFTATRSHFTTASTLDPAAIRAIARDMEDELRGRAARAASVKPLASAFRHTVEARYAMQVWEIPIGLDLDVGDDALGARITAAFHDEHERLFGVRDTTSDVELLLWRLELRHAIASPEALHAGLGAATAAGPPRTRTASFDGLAATATPVFRADELALGHVVTGPAIIYEPTTTLVVPPGFSAELTPRGYYRMVPS